MYSSGDVPFGLKFVAGYLLFFVAPGYVLANLLVSEMRVGKLDPVAALATCIAVSTAIYPVLFMLRVTDLALYAAAITFVCAALLGVRSALRSQLSRVKES